ncbi:hypothetical protein ACFWOJ_15955 [Streptomyces sp. NPDC058439]|uniref:8-oxoguanine DNA glycosylase OGG fold protein n=1 Tax=Streptomyces sp. NPDC058439 TaxID=3346500 RepID=UPI00365E4DFB
MPTASRSRQPGGLARRTITGRSDGADSVVVSRADLFSMAASVDSDGSILRLLWHVLAWGSGSKLHVPALLSREACGTRVTPLTCDDLDFTGTLKKGVAHGAASRRSHVGKSTEDLAILSRELAGRARGVACHGAGTARDPRRGGAH